MERGPLNALRLLLFLRCAEADRLMSERLDRRLSRSESAALRAHVAICRSCRKAVRQFELIRDAAEQHRTEPAPALAGEARLSDAARARIAERLRDRRPRRDAD